MKSLQQHPAWYGAVMGTGGLALALSAESSTWQLAWLEWLARIGLVMTSVLAVILLPRYIARLRDRSELASELGDPGHGASLSTLPAGLLVSSIVWSKIGAPWLGTGIGLGVAAVLLVLGVVIAIVLGISWSSLILRATPGLEAVNGTWLIPPVMNLIVAVAIAPFVVAIPAWSTGLVLLAFAFFGIGLVLFLAMFTLLIARLALRAPFPPPLAPSLWIPLAPAGMIGVALIRVQQAAEAAGVPGFTGTTLGVAVATMFVGLGFWWAAFAYVEFRRLRKAGAAVHPGWWGLVFPMGAMTISIIVIGSTVGSVVVNVLGAIATAVLVLVWLAVASATAKLSRKS